ncbi:hypothetical protein BTVI_138693 [Pitangus sulphuratus]|nr:hypothetical protein BTVI_138693 [Pitangus sulphuratus]
MSSQFLQENDVGNGVKGFTKVQRVDLMSEEEIGGCFGHSDHKANEFKISVNRRKNASKTSSLDMERTDFRLLRELLSKVPLENVLAGSAAPAESLQIHGPDGIHPRILKDLADVISKSPSMIFRRSWESEEVPADWKLANVVPVFNKGKKEDPGNYRPVSLISVSGKIMENIILGGSEKHLEDNAVLQFSHSQHHFMRGKSYLSNLISFHDSVIHVIDQGK